LRRITLSACIKSSEDRKTLDKSETKILKSKGSRLWENTRENGTNRREKRKRIIYEDLLRAVCKERLAKEQDEKDRIT